MYLLACVFIFITELKNATHCRVLLLIYSGSANNSQMICYIMMIPKISTNRELSLNKEMIFCSGP